MVPDRKQTPSAKLNPQDLWNEISLTRSGIDELLKQSQQTGDLQPVHAAIEDLKLKTANYEQVLEEMQAPMKAVLGRNLLGTAEWQQGFGVKVAAPPPIPESITPELLNSPCSLHPGELIKDTHILLLMPKTVDGKPYSALKLDELCASRKGSGERLIFDQKDWANSWKTNSWANLSQALSEWVLIPKSEPDIDKVPFEKHFWFKDIVEQQKVLEDHYSEYREAKALEVMTMALLYDVTNKERPLSDYLRCTEPNASGGRVCIGRFSQGGLTVDQGYDGNDDAHIGRALARKM